jgi:hypothetical protein
MSGQKRKRYRSGCPSPTQGHVACGFRTREQGGMLTLPDLQGCLSNNKELFNYLVDLTDSL